MPDASEEQRDLTPRDPADDCAALGPDWAFGGAELLFLEVEEGQERSAVLSAEDWKTARGPFLKVLSERVEAIASGRFPIRPEEGERGLCSRCEFPTVCRKAHGPSRARGVSAAIEGPKDLDPE